MKSLPSSTDTYIMSNMKCSSDYFKNNGWKLLADKKYNICKTKPKYIVDIIVTWDTLSSRYYLVMKHGYKVIGRVQNMITKIKTTKLRNVWIRP